MSADDDKNESPDPWADLVADDLGAEGDEVSFSFVEKTQPAPQEEGQPVDEAASELDPVVEPHAEAGEEINLEAAIEAELLAGDVNDLAGMADAAAEEVAAADADAFADTFADTFAADADEVADDDAEVGAWLSASEGEAAEPTENDMPLEQEEATPPLSVFAPEELASEQPSPSSIEIGTGFSGIDMSAEGEGSNADTETETLEAWDGAEAAAPVAVAAVAAATTPRKPVAKPRAKGGGLGPMIGVVAGGVMAIPITMAILLWGFQKDPFGVAKQIPESMSFLLPQKFQRGFKVKKQAGGLSDLAAAPSLDDLAAAGPSADAAAPGGDQAAEPVPPAAEPAAEGAPDSEPASPAPDSLDAAVAAVDPLAAPAEDAAKPEEPLFPDPDAPAATTPDPLADAAPAPAVAPAEPVTLPPLDTAALEAAVADVATALEAAAAAEDHTQLAGKKLLVDWYKSLARTADELVKLQNEAADSGRPLDGVPDQVASVYDGLAKEKQVAAALPLLARGWLDYARRDSEGVFVPVTFGSVKKVGPYWRSKVTLEDGAHSRELAIISRDEPAAVAGEKLLVTGVVFDGDVIWAAEVRAMPAEPASVNF